MAPHQIPRFDSFEYVLRYGSVPSSVRAVARLTYDDFVHAQSTLVRALARTPPGWWDDSEVLEPQTTLEDRKLLLGYLADEASQVVAAANGWMGYLLRRKQQATRQHQRPSPTDLVVMRDTFCRLNYARTLLAGAVAGADSTSGWTYSSFDEGAVLESLDHPATLESLGISDSQCVARRADGYGRHLSLRAARPAAGLDLQLDDPLDG
jgi:hypothetical protein